MVTAGALCRRPADRRKMPSARLPGTGHEPLPRPGWTLAVLLCLAAAGAGGEGWPQFRGAGGRGIAGPDADPPIAWSEGENVAWKTAIHGRGWSSPVVADGRIWMTTATPEGTKMYALCAALDDGRILHDVLLFENADPADINRLNSYASPTPCLGGGRAFAHFGTYGTAGLDANTGRVLWTRRDLNCDHAVGPGSSPILVDGRLILLLDGTDVQFVVALDPATGRTVWRTPRNIDFGKINPDRRKAFSTPLVVDTPTGRQLVAPAAEFAIAYDPADGRELWRVRYPGGYSTASAPVACPGGLVAVNSGFPRPKVLAVRTDGRGDVTGTHVAWRLRRGGPNKPSPLCLDGLLYVLHDGGTLNCLDARTGETVWRERIGGRFSASPVAASGRVYLFDQDGMATVIAAGRSFRELAENPLAAGCMASPAVVGESLIVRTKTHLYRLRKQQPAAREHPRCREFHATRPSPRRQPKRDRR